MRILKEDTEIKETIPVSFLTDLMSKSWDEVGYLKESSAAIKETYKDTSKVEELMQDLMDAYLVFIGQLELYLDQENNISPETEEPKEADVKGEKTVEVEEEEREVSARDEDQVPFPDAKVKINPIENKVENNITEPADTIPNVEDEDFDFYVDFDEPDLSKPGVSEKDIYGEEDSEFEYNKLKAQLLS